MRPTSIPLGRFAGSIASFATSLMVSVRLDFGLENTPSAKLISSASSWRMCAAMCFAFSVMRSAAIITAEPPIVADRGRRHPAGAFPDEDFVGIALNVMHLLGIDAEAVAHDLLEDRLMPLALG